MKKNNKYATLVEATERLKARGFTYDFDVKTKGVLEVLDHDDKFSTDQVKLQEFHRFEGMTDPGDMAIIYALETDSGMKGTIVDAYGSDGSVRISEFVDHVKQRQFKD